MMKILVLFFILISICSSSRVNTTNFFEQKVGYGLSYQTYSGYYDIDWYYPSGSAGMYYSFTGGMGKKIADKTVPLIVWLDGGPGSSSQKGAFTMVGPLSIEENQGNYTVNENGWAWSIYGHMLFVDQPLDVGFSYNKNKRVDNTYDASHHFINFMHNFYKEWGMIQNPLYIAGISYAGHYIPVIARNIITNMSLGFNLKGVMIGGPWVQPVTQGNFVDSLLTSVGILSESGRTTAASMQNEATINVLNGKLAEAGGYYNWIEDQQISQKFFGGVYLSNYRYYEKKSVSSDFAKFLQQNKQQFGVPDDVSFKAFNQDIYQAFVASGDFAKSMGDEVDFILNRGLRTLFFNGQNDIEVPVAGTLTFLNTIEWHNLPHWQRATKQPWKSVYTTSGWIKKYGNFAFVFVKDAGHLTPADKPKETLTILNNFIHNIW